MTVMSNSMSSKSPKMRLDNLFKCYLSKKDFKTSLPQMSLTAQYNNWFYTSYQPIMCEPVSLNPRSLRGKTNMPHTAATTPQSLVNDQQRCLTITLNTSLSLTPPSPKQQCDLPVMFFGCKGAEEMEFWVKIKVSSNFHFWPGRTREEI